MIRRALLALGLVAVAALLAGAAGALWLRGELRASLPLLDGEIALRGLSEPVVVERDASGIPTLSARDRLDLARATGFVHAQERFFQMDLLRRTSAGEVAALLGVGAVEWDREIRIHRFRARASRALGAHGSEEARLLEAYAAGVNAGLAALGAPPPEYLLLRQALEPWRPEDTLLVALAMFITLQDHAGRRESDLGVMHDLLPAPVFDLLAAPGTEWDAPLAGPAFETPPVPGPEVYDLRGRPAEPPGTVNHLPAPSPGSNAFAVSGALGSDGGAILASDMHLGLSVPNIWYRASLAWSDGSGEPHRVTGVTLPGTPAVIVGSNGRIAWGFTNSYGDFSDLVVLEEDPRDPEAYLAPGGPRRFERHRERVRVRGGEDQVVEVLETLWGPVIDRDHRGRRRALRWVAHDPAAVDIGLMRLETARDVEEAIRTGAACGAPAQNLVVADSAGRVAWSILGRIPRRVGFDGLLPVSWADGARRWEGWLAPEEYPRVVDPPAGRVWSANNRAAEGEALRALGDGGFALGARAGRIRDRLLERERFGERDLLDVQLDDRAVLLDRWRDLLLRLLTAQAVAADPRRSEFRRLVEESWTGRAAIDSVGYRLVRAFRRLVIDEVVEAVTASCKQADERFAPALFQAEGTVWRIVQERPAHLLPGHAESWEAALLGAVDQVLDELLRDGGTLEEKTWGDRNTVRVRHALSRGAPFLARWLDLPSARLPGDMDVPRVQAPSFGASERMVVSPGHEERGLFHMPGGQSGHFLSPHYGDGHEAWARGEATPFLPGPAAHRLVLEP